MSEPFWPIDPQAWLLALELLPRPLEPELVRMHLRHLLNEARRGVPFPGEREIATQVGWSRKRLRVLLRTETWWHPNFPPGADTLTPTRARVPVRAQSGPSQERSNAEKGRVPVPVGAQSGTSPDHIQKDKKQRSPPTPPRGEDPDSVVLVRALLEEGASAAAQAAREQVERYDDDLAEHTRFLEELTADGLQLDYTPAPPPRPDCTPEEAAARARQAFLDRARALDPTLVAGVRRRLGLTRQRDVTRLVLEALRQVRR